MKFLCLLVSFIFINSSVAQTRISVSEYGSLTTEQRRKLFSGSVVDHLGDQNELLDLFMIGIQDPDPVVQRNAVGQLGNMIVGLQRFKHERGLILADMSKIGEVQDLLAAKLSSSDSQVRGSAVQALAYSGEPNAKVESVLLGHLAKEPNSQIKGGIIESMGVAGYDSDAYVQALQVGILDQSSYVREAAVKSVLVVKPPGALPLLVQALEKYKTGVHWAPQAIGAYGSAAQPYLPNLENLIADPATPSELKEAIRNAINVIRYPPNKQQHRHRPR